MTSLGCGRLVTAALFKFNVKTLENYLLSVVIPVYNMTRFFEPCIASLSPESNSWMQVIVVDDGSALCDTDIIRMTIQRHNGSNNVVYYRTEHRGAAAARNAAISISEGRFLWFVDADDCVVKDRMQCLFSILDELPDDTELFHTGPMTPLSEEIPACSGFQVTKVNAVDLVIPRSACFDHTTYIVSRAFLCREDELRYPENYSILEDSLFVIGLLEKARQVYKSDDLSIYLLRENRYSATSGPWNTEQSTRFVTDICNFFNRLYSFSSGHDTCRHLSQTYRRYRYVYMRVLAVKGVRWRDIKRFRDTVPELAKTKRFTSFSIAEFLLSIPLVHRLMAFLCRHIRKVVCYSM